MAQESAPGKFAAGKFPAGKFGSGKKPPPASCPTMHRGKLETFDTEAGARRR
jgi:hypothetical protein